MPVHENLIVASVPVFPTHRPGGAPTTWEPLWTHAASVPSSTPPPETSSHSLPIKHVHSSKRSSASWMEPFSLELHSPSWTVSSSLFIGTLVASLIISVTTFRPLSSLYWYPQHLAWGTYANDTYWINNCFFSEIQGPAQIMPPFYYKIISMEFCNITVSHSSTLYILGEMFKLNL